MQMTDLKVKRISIQELKAIVKKRERERFSAMWFLEPIQVYCSYALIRIGLNSTQVAVLWLISAYVAYLLMAVGKPWAYMAGSILILVKTILDGCDGEIARFEKQFISESDDFRSFINGIYLDKVFHIIEKPLWGVSIAYGIYRTTGYGWILIPGIFISLHHAFWRVNASLKQDLPREFLGRYKNLKNTLKDRSSLGPNKEDSILVRMLDKLDLWLRNGKWFNSIAFGAAATDAALLGFGLQAFACLVMVLIFGGIAPILVIFQICRIFNSEYMLKACDAIYRAETNL